MSVIANLDERVGTVLIESIAKQRAASEEAAAEEPAARSAESNRSQVAAGRDLSLDSRPYKRSPITVPLPVWLL